MIIGFTGTQHGMTNHQEIGLRSYLSRRRKVTWLHHGDCVGADAQAHELATHRGIDVAIHPPTNPRKRAFKKGTRTFEPKPYLNRNKDIVNACDMLIAAPYEEHEKPRSGTWSTINYARRVGKPVVIILPDGSLIIIP